MQQDFEKYADEIRAGLIKDAIAHDDADSELPPASVPAPFDPEWANISPEEYAAAEKRAAAAAQDDDPAENEEITITGLQVSIDVVALALDQLKISIQYNMLLKEVEINGLPDEYSAESAVSVLPAYLLDYLKANKCKGVTTTRISECLFCIADRNRINPIEVYLNSMEWDGKDRFSTIYGILGIEQEKYQVYVFKWLLQCVALGLNDLRKQVSAEGVLVFHGFQGLGKTQFFKIITPSPRWFVEGATIDMNIKDTLITALSGWITELGELDATLMRDQSSLKAFVTRSEDRIRIPYARNDTRAPRRTSFCGTVNKDNYLKDETGSRRFWTVHLDRIDKEALFGLRKTDFVDQLWAQVYRLFKQNPNAFRLTDAETALLQADNHQYDVPLPYELEIRELLDFSLPIEEWEWWRPSEFVHILSYPGDYRQIGKALAKIIKFLASQQPSIYGVPSYNAPNKFIKRPLNKVQYLLPMKHITPL